MQPSHDHKGHIDAILLGRKGVKLVMQKYETRPIQTILGSLVHVPLFILMAYSARDMIRSGNFQGLESGGFLYWTNLKESDETFLLPLLACGSTYWNIELALKNKSQIWTQLGQGIQFVPLLAFPLMSTLPQGVFFYWLGSSWSSMAQTLAMNNNAFRRRLGLQPRIAAPERQLPAAAADASQDEVGVEAEQSASSPSDAQVKNASSS
ncbi:Cytochrome oxidase biogenesis, partial [Globisporangium splendens]